MLHLQLYAFSYHSIIINRYAHSVAWTAETELQRNPAGKAHSTFRGIGWIYAVGPQGSLDRRPLGLNFQRRLQSAYFASVERKASSPRETSCLYARMAFVAIIALLAISLFGVKSLLIFSSRNGAFGYFEGAVNAGCTPSGQPLRPLTTYGRFPKVDQQIKAVCVFFLLYCEDWQVPETSLAGWSFVGAWGASWALIMLDSLRMYSQHYFLSWSVVQSHNMVLYVVDKEPQDHDSRHHHLQLLSRDFHANLPGFPPCVYPGANSRRSSN